MDIISDSDLGELVYPRIVFTGVTSDQHLLPFMSQGSNKSTAIMSYAIKRGTVIETGPFLFNHLSVAHILYLGIGIEVFSEPGDSRKIETTEDLVKIATFKSQR